MYIYIYIYIYIYNVYIYIYNVYIYIYIYIQIFIKKYILCKTYKSHAVIEVFGNRCRKDIYF